MRGVVAALCVAGALAGCGDGGKGGGGRADSESHWLKACAADAECGELRCLCGVCTLPCEAGCEGLGEAAMCGGLVGGGCEAPAQVCTATCDEASACGDLPCHAGVCQRLVNAHDAAAADGGVRDGGATDARAPDGLPPDAGDAAVAPDAGATCGHPESACRAHDDCGPLLCGAPDAEDRCACVAPMVEAHPCPPAEGCCSAADCPAGSGRATCQRQGHDAQDAYCGGAAPQPVNECVTDACARDADCGAGQACVRAGEHGHVRSACVPAACRADADCAERAGGRCTAFFTSCWVRGFACSYADDPCRVDADCPQRGARRVCLPRTDGFAGTACVEALPSP
jgi:hypothetical protein